MWLITDIIAGLLTFSPGGLLAPGFKNPAMPARAIIPWWVLCDAYRSGRVFVYECGDKLLDPSRNVLPRGLARPSPRDMVYRGSVLAAEARSAVAVAYAGWDGSGRHYVDVVLPGRLRRYLVPAWAGEPAVPEPVTGGGAVTKSVRGDLLVFEPVVPGEEALVLALRGLPAADALDAMARRMGRPAGLVLSPLGVRCYVFGWRVVACTYAGSLYRVLAPDGLLDDILHALEEATG